MVRYASEKDKANRIVHLTSLTVEQLEALVELFEQAFVRHMSEWTMEGKARTGRAYSQYANCPLPTPEDRLLFLLCYMKVASIQEAHAALFGMTQSNANKWIHLLMVVLHQTHYPKEVHCCKTSALWVLHSIMFRSHSHTRSHEVVT